MEKENEHSAYVYYCCLNSSSKVFSFKMLTVKEFISHSELLFKKIAWEIDYIRRECLSRLFVILVVISMMQKNFQPL